MGKAALDTILHAGLSREPVEKAKTAASCAVSIRNTGHIGRLGEYAEEAARAGCIALITVGGGGRGKGPTVPFGGTEGAFSTNPIAIGVPTGDDSPFIVDYATSMVAEGKNSGRSEQRYRLT